MYCTALTTPAAVEDLEGSSGAAEKPFCSVPRVEQMAQHNIASPASGTPGARVPSVGIESGRSTNRKGNLSLLRKANFSFTSQKRFVDSAAHAVLESKLSHTVGSFLPTSLMHQLHDAVNDTTINPRLSCERPGVYLTLAFSSLHVLLELPMEAGLAEVQLKKVFTKIANLVHQGGGEVLRMTPDSALCVWRVPDPVGEIVGSHLDAASFDDVAPLREATMMASKCALDLVEKLHDFVLWADQSFDAHAKLRAKRRAMLTANSLSPSTPASNNPSPKPPPAKSTPGPGKKLWGKANEKITAGGSLSSVPGSKRGASGGLHFLGAVKAANKRAETGEGLDVKLSLGAAITLSMANAVHVGGNHNRWEYVVLARELSDACQVLMSVDHGDILVSESLWSMFPSDLLQPHVSVDEWKRIPDGASLRVPSSKIQERMQERIDLMKRLPLATMRSYVPGPLWPKILAGDPLWISEHSEQRAVTVLLLRLKAPKDAPIHMQAAAYTAAIGAVQVALYRHYGTFKHMVQDHDGCTVAACLGLQPFLHSEVSCSRAAVQIAIDVRRELGLMGVSAYAAVYCGEAWIGAVGSDTRREYVIIGAPMQLAGQMLGFATEENPVIVDPITSQANKTKYNCVTLSMSICMPGQMKQHSMLAVREPREDTMETGTAPSVSYDVARWLRIHNMHTAKASVVQGELSDAAQYQMWDCFKQLDEDSSGSISINELLEAIKEVDTLDDGSPQSLLYSVSRMMKEMDHDESGNITFDEFLAMASGAYDQANDADAQQKASQNLPLLLTAHTTRKRLQNRLGDEFISSYPSARGGTESKIRQRRSETLGPNDHIMTAGDDAVDLEYFSDMVQAMEPDRGHTDAALKKRFESFLLYATDRTVDRRTYARALLLERVRRSSSQAVEIFTRMDTNHVGKISQADWRRGLRSLKLGPNDGFTESDANALCSALDIEGTKMLEYGDAIGKLQHSRTRKEALGRLRSQENSSQQRSIPPRRQGSTNDLPLDGNGWMRHHRRQSVAEVLMNAEADANKMQVELSKSEFGDKKRTMQKMVDDVDVIYGHYRAQRDKLGPVRRLAGDKNGSLAALLSPRVHTSGGSFRVEGATAASTVASPRLTPRPPPLSVPSRAASSIYSPRSPTTWTCAPSTARVSEPPGSVQGEVATPWTQASTASYLRTMGERPPPLLHIERNLAEISSDKLPHYLSKSPRVPFQGPPPRPRPAEGSFTPRRQRSKVPPSSLVPLTSEGGSLASSGTHSGTPKRGSGPWESSEQAVAKEKKKVEMRGQTKDHQQHALSSREPSAWQRQLRRAERERLMDGCTTQVTRSEQTTRIEAFRCLRQTHLPHDSPRLRDQLELGAFGRVGMGISSRPNTPAEEKAMRAWVAGDGISADDVTTLKAAQTASLRTKQIHELSREEQRSWLQDPVKRSSFAPIADILQMHGVEDDFRRAGAPGLERPDTLDGALGDLNVGSEEQSFEEDPPWSPGRISSVESVHKARKALQQPSRRLSRAGGVKAGSRTGSSSLNPSSPAVGGVQSLRRTVALGILPATRMALAATGKNTGLRAALPGRSPGSFIGSPRT